MSWRCMTGDHAAGVGGSTARECLPRDRLRRDRATAVVSASLTDRKVNCPVSRRVGREEWPELPKEAGAQDVGASGERKSPPYPIASVDNALKLLLSFRSQDAIRVSAASKQLGVAQSTASRLLAMLEYHGLATKDAATGQYVPGPNLLGLALSVMGQLDLWQQAHSHVEDLRNQLNETVHVGVLHGNEIVYIGGLESMQSLRVGLRVGLSLPAHATSGGKVLLAEQPSKHIRASYPAELPRQTAATITSRDELERKLAQVREQGYAVSHAENEPGVSSLAVPVRDARGQAVTALVVTAPTSRAGADWEQRVLAAAVTTAQQLGAKLHGEQFPPVPGGGVEGATSRRGR